MVEVGMNKATLRSDVMLLLTSAIWGFGFVAQVQGMDYLDPYLFNGLRFALGGASLLPLILLSKNGKKVKNTRKDKKDDPPHLWPGAAAGILLFLGATLQQIGIQYTTAGKAGFITGLYVVLVPILGILLKHKTGRGTWIGAVLAAVGLYFITVTGGFRMGRGDFLILLCSFFFACHVLAIDRFAKKYNVLLLSALQFTVCSLLSLVFAILFETIDPTAIRQAFFPILYGGLGTVGIAYTLQVVGQRNAPPSHSAILLSLESLFAFLGGVLFLSETMSGRGYMGCFLMLAGMMASQWDVIFSPGKNPIPERKE